MGKLVSEVHDHERVIRTRNAICSEMLLRALRQHHCVAEVEVTTEPEPEPSPPLPPISNETFREASNLAETACRGFSEVIRIMRAVSAHTGVSIADLKSERKSHQIVRPRQYVYYLGKKLTTASMPAIGRQLGKDHTSVLWGIKKIEKLRATNSKINGDIIAIAASMGVSLD